MKEVKKIFFLLFFLLVLLLTPIYVLKLWSIYLTDSSPKLELISSPSSPTTSLSPESEPEEESVLVADQSCKNQPFKRFFYPDFKHFDSFYDAENKYFDSYLNQFTSFTDYESYTSFQEPSFETTNEKAAPVWWSVKQTEENTVTSDDFFFENDISTDFFSDKKYRYLMKVANEQKVLSPAIFKKKLANRLKAIVKVFQKYYFWLNNLFGEKLLLCEKITIGNQEKIYKYYVSLHNDSLGKLFNSQLKESTTISDKVFTELNDFSFTNFNWRYWISLLFLLHLNPKHLATFLETTIKKTIIKKWGQKILLAKKAKIDTIILDHQKSPQDKSKDYFFEWIRSNTKITTDSIKKMQKFATIFPNFFPNYVNPLIDGVFSDFTLVKNGKENSFIDIDLKKIKLITNGKGEIIDVEKEDNSADFTLDEENLFSTSHFNLLKFAAFAWHKKTNEIQKPNEKIKKLENLIKKQINKKTQKILEILVKNISLIKNADFQEIFIEWQNREKKIDLNKIKIMERTNQILLKEKEKISDPTIEAEFELEKIKNSYGYLDYLTYDAVAELVKIDQYLREVYAGTNWEKEREKQLKDIFDANANLKFGTVFEQLKANHHLLSYGDINSFTLTIEGEQIRFLKQNIDDIVNFDNIKELSKNSSARFLFSKLKQLNLYIQNQQETKPDFSVKKIFLQELEEKFLQLWNFLKPALEKLAVFAIDHFTYNGIKIEKIEPLINQKKRPLENLDEFAFIKLREIIVAAKISPSYKTSFETINQQFNQGFKQSVEAKASQDFTDIQNSLNKMRISKTNKLFLNSLEKEQLREATKLKVETFLFDDLLEETKSSTINVFDLSLSALKQLFFLQIIRDQLGKNLPSILDQSIVNKYQSLWTKIKNSNYIPKLQAAKITPIQLTDGDDEELLKPENLATEETLTTIIVTNFDLPSGPKKIEAIKVIEILASLYSKTFSSLEEIFQQTLKEKLGSYLLTIKNHQPLKKSGLSRLHYLVSNPNLEQAINLEAFFAVENVAQLSALNITKLSFFAFNNQNKTISKIIDENINHYWKEKLSLFENETVNDGLVKKKLQAAGITSLLVEKGSFNQIIKLTNIWNFNQSHPFYLNTLEILKKIFLDQEISENKIKMIIKQAIDDKYQAILEKLRTNKYKLLSKDFKKYQGLITNQNQPSTLSVENLTILKEIYSLKEDILTDLDSKISEILNEKWDLLKVNLSKLQAIKARQLVVIDALKTNKRATLDLTKLTEKELNQLNEEELTIVKKLVDYSQIDLKQAIDKAIITTLSLTWNLLINSQKLNLLKLKNAGIKILSINDENVSLIHLFQTEANGSFPSLTVLDATKLTVLFKLKTVNQDHIDNALDRYFQTSLITFKSWREKLISANINQLVLNNDERINLNFLFNFNNEITSLTPQNLAQLTKLQDDDLLALIKTNLMAKLEDIIDLFRETMWFFQVTNWQNLLKKPTDSDNEKRIINISKIVTEGEDDGQIFAPNKIWNQLRAEIIEELIVFWRADSASLRNQFLENLNFTIQARLQPLWTAILAKKSRLQKAKIESLTFDNKTITIDLLKFWVKTNSLLNYKKSELELKVFWQELIKLQAKIINPVNFHAKVVAIIEEKLTFVWKLIKSFLPELLASETFTIDDELTFDFAQLELNQPKSTFLSSKAKLTYMVTENLEINQLNDHSLELLADFDLNLEAAIKVFAFAPDLDQTTSKKTKKIIYLNHTTDKVIAKQLNPFWQVVHAFLPKMIAIKDLYQGNFSLINQKLTINFNDLSQPWINFFSHQGNDDFISLLTKFSKKSLIIKQEKITLIKNLLAWKKTHQTKTAINQFIRKKINDVFSPHWTNLLPQLKKSAKIGLKTIKLQVLSETVDISPLFLYLEQAVKPAQFKDQDFPIFLQFVYHFFDNQSLETFFNKKINSFLAAKLAVFQDAEFVQTIKSLKLEQSGLYQQLNLDNLLNKQASQLTPQQFDALAKLTKNKTPTAIRAVVFSGLKTKITKVWNWIKPYLNQINLLSLTSMTFHQGEKSYQFDFTVLQGLTNNSQLANLPSEAVRELDKLNHFSNQTTFLEKLTDSFANHQNLANKLLFFQENDGNALLIKKIKTSQLEVLSHNQTRLSIKKLLNSGTGKVINLSLEDGTSDQESSLGEINQFKNFSLAEIVQLVKKTIDDHFAMIDDPTTNVWTVLERFFPKIIATNLIELETATNLRLAISNLKKLSMKKISALTPAGDDFTFLAYQELEAIKKIVNNDSNKVEKIVKNRIENKLAHFWSILQPWLVKFAFAQINQITINNSPVVIDLLITNRAIENVYQLSPQTLTLLLSLFQMKVEKQIATYLNRMAFVWTTLQLYLPKLEAAQIANLSFLIDDQEERVDFSLFWETRNLVAVKEEKVTKVYLLDFSQLKGELATINRIYQWKKPLVKQSDFQTKIGETIDQTISNKLKVVWQNLIPFLLKSKKIAIGEIVIGEESKDITILTKLNFNFSSLQASYLPKVNQLTAPAINLVTSFLTKNLTEIFTPYLNSNDLTDKLVFLQTPTIQANLNAAKVSQKKSAKNIYWILTSQSFKQATKPSELTVEEWNFFIDLVWEEATELAIKTKINRKISSTVNLGWEKIKVIIPLVKIVKFDQLILNEEVTIDLTSFFEIDLANPFFNAQQIEELEKISSASNRSEIVNAWNKKLNEEGNLKSNLKIFFANQEKLIKSQLPQLLLNNGKTVPSNFWAKDGKSLDLPLQDFDVDKLKLLTLTKAITSAQLQLDINSGLEDHLSNIFSFLETNLPSLKKTAISSLKREKTDPNPPLSLTYLLADLFSGEEKKDLDLANLSADSLKELFKLKELNFNREQFQAMINDNLEEKLLSSWNNIRNYLSRINLLERDSLVVNIGLVEVRLRAILKEDENAKLIALTLETLGELMLMKNKSKEEINQAVENAFANKLTVSWEIFYALLAKLQAANIRQISLDEEKNLLFQVEDFYPLVGTWNSNQKFSQQDLNFLRENMKIYTYQQVNNDLQNFLQEKLTAKFNQVWQTLIAKKDHLLISKINNLTIASKNIFINDLLEEIEREKLTFLYQLTPPSLATLLQLKEATSLLQVIKNTINDKFNQAWNYLQKDYDKLKIFSLENLVLSFDNKETVLDISLFNSHLVDNDEGVPVLPAQFGASLLGELMKINDWSLIEWEKWVDSLTTSQFATRWDETIKQGLRKFDALNVEVISYQDKTYQLAELFQSLEKKIADFSPQALNQLQQLPSPLLAELRNADSDLLKSYAKGKYQAKIDKVHQYLTNLLLLEIDEIVLSTSGKKTEKLNLTIFENKKTSDDFLTKLNDIQELAKLEKLSLVKITEIIVSYFAKKTQPLWDLLQKKYLARLENSQLTSLTINHQTSSIAFLLQEKNQLHSHFLTESAMKELKQLLDAFSAAQLIDDQITLPIFLKQNLHQNLANKLDVIINQFLLDKDKIINSGLKRLSFADQTVALDFWQLDLSKKTDFNNSLYLDLFTPNQLANLTLLEEENLKLIIEENINAHLAPTWEKITSEQKLEKFFLLNLKKFTLSSLQNETDKENFQFNLAFIYQEFKLVLPTIDSTTTFVSHLPALELLKSLKEKNIANFSLPLLTMINGLKTFSSDPNLSLAQFLNHYPNMLAKWEILWKNKTKLLTFKEVWRKEAKLFTDHWSEFLTYLELTREKTAFKLTDLSLPLFWILSQISEKTDDLYYQTVNLNQIIDQLYQAILQVFGANFARLKSLKLRSLKPSTSDSDQVLETINIKPLLDLWAKNNSERLQSSTMADQPLKSLKKLAKITDYDGDNFQKMINENINSQLQTTYQKFLKLKKIIKFLKITSLPRAAKGKKKIKIKPLYQTKRKKAADLSLDATNVLKLFLNFSPQKAVNKLVRKNYEREIVFLQKNFLRLQKGKLAMIYLDQDQAIDISFLLKNPQLITEGDIDLAFARILVSLHKTNLKNLIKENLKRKYGKKWKSFKPIFSKLKKASINSLQLKQEMKRKKINHVVAEINKEEISDLSDDSLQEFTFFSEYKTDQLKKILKQELNDKYDKIWKILQKNRTVFEKPNPQLIEFAKENEINLTTFKKFLQTNQNKKTEELADEIFPELNKMLDKEEGFFSVEEEESDNYSLNGGVVAIIFVFVIFSIAILGVYLSFSSNSSPKNKKTI